MRYLLAIFFPFAAFFTIGSKISGIVCTAITAIIAILMAVYYPMSLYYMSPLIFLHILFILWAFFEINDFHTKRTIQELKK